VMHPFIHISRFVSNRHLFISSGWDL